ncbi:unnamed protein product [Rangifer tarandus platyrhynchus]|uniref:Uncharacterized protein n=2 Tax=Rangifer tarandus platyrhynchus TaxID=3082113 RepID=A0ABN8YJT1_RANTA|nr:unnamed protein product [Rangifer tarandus platyrhynchus]
MSVCTSTNFETKVCRFYLTCLTFYVKALKGPQKARIMKQMIIYSLLYFFRIKHICIKIKPKIYFPFPLVINTKINLSRFCERFCQPVSQNIAPHMYLRKAVKKNCGIFFSTTLKSLLRV